MKPHSFSWGFFVAPSVAAMNSKAKREQKKILAAGVIALAATLFPAARSRAGVAQVSPSATHVVLDETGRRVAVPVTVRRIVSLAPNLTETLYALGAQDRLVGVTDYCDYPPEARTKPRVGGVRNPSLEAILAQKPDLVFATTAINRLETVQALERLRIPVYATDPRSVAGVLVSIRHIAELIGAGAQGEALTAHLETQLAELRQRLAGSVPKRALFVVWEDPLISIGPRTFLADALRLAGAESVVQATQDWPQLSLEEVVRQHPEYVVFASSDASSGAKQSEELRARPVWRDLAAVRQHHVAIVSDAIDSPAPRLIAAVEQLARELHPEAFATDPESRKEKMENRQEPDNSHARSSFSQSPFSNFHFPSSPEPCLCSR
jgi:iron complex transport system substrate-binding protein